MTILAICLGLVVILSIVLLISTLNLVKKVERYEDTIEGYENEIDQRDEFIQKMITYIDASDVKIHQLDQQGTFEADDEIGFFFQNLKQIQTYMNSYRDSFKRFKEDNA